MSRTGVEVKPRWKSVPETVRQEVSTLLGSPVVRASRVWGGYGPTPTFRLVLADGRRAFFKGTFNESNEFMKNALEYEEGVYRNIYGVLGNCMPKFYGVFHAADWHCLLLEDVGPQSVPPWNTRNAREITQAIAAFHQMTLNSITPDWLVQPADLLSSVNWASTTSASDNFKEIAALVEEDAPLALEWFKQFSPTIELLMSQPVLKAEPLCIIHGDLRSDNLRYRGKRLYLFDWPFIALSRPEFDIVGFAQSVAVEGGPLPEQVVAWYREKSELDTDAINGSIAWLLALFADRAWRPEIPGLPRLRRFQRQQLGTLILWLARQLSLPAPFWANKLLK